MQNKLHEMHHQQISRTIERLRLIKSIPTNTICHFSSIIFKITSTCDDGADKQLPRLLNSHRQKLFSLSRFVSCLCVCKDSIKLDKDAEALATEQNLTGYIISGGCKKERNTRNYR